MPALLFTRLKLADATVAGLLGALTGLGGGVVLVPLLRLVFHTWTFATRSGLADLGDRNRVGSRGGLFHDV